MSFVIAVLRVVYDKEELTVFRILLEALLCGALTATIGSAMIALGYDQQWYLAIGGTVGFMGTQSIRALAYKVINRKVGK